MWHDYCVKKYFVLQLPYLLKTILETSQLTSLCILFKCGCANVFVVNNYVGYSFELPKYSLASVNYFLIGCQNNRAAACTWHCGEPLLCAACMWGCGASKDTLQQSYIYPCKHERVDAAQRVEVRRAWKSLVVIVFGVFFILWRS